MGSAEGIIGNLDNRHARVGARLDLPRAVRQPGPTVCCAHHEALRYLLHVILAFNLVGFDSGKRG
jgi:hypothetical protein